MKKLCTLVSLSVLLLLATEALCSTALISVELPTMENKQAWHQLGIPTYELIGNTAIAETEESRIGSLKQKGYLIEIIDRQPELARYMILLNPETSPAMQGKPIWQNDKTAIIKPSSKGLYLDQEYKHIIRPMNTRPLGERFWKSNTTKYVTLKSIPYDPFIQSLVDQVNADSITSYIQRLQNFGTRYSLSDSSYAASEWISSKFMEWGLDAELDSVYVALEPTYKGWGRSAVGKIPGSTSKNIFACGHMDTSPFSSPGADDDASGVAGAMEIARIFSKYSWVATLKFAGWDGEETGGWGSTHYAMSADSSGESIVGVINMDMLGYMSDSVMNGEVWHYYDCSSWLSDLFINIGKTYVPAISYDSVLSSVACDQRYFECLGYPAITAIEPNPFGNPYIHTSHDSLVYLTPAFYVAFVQTSLATMAYLSENAIVVDSVEVHDPGNGSQLIVSWASNKELDVVQYRIYWGRQSEVYNDSTDTDSLAFTISGLVKDSTYYICVRAITLDGNVSFTAREVTGIPRMVPMMPTGLWLKPMIMSITINWTRSNELDLSGYRIFRKIGEGIWDSLNTAFINDTTTITDNVPDRDSKYWYRLRAYDNDGNVSSYTDSVSAYTYAAAGLKATPMNNIITLEWPKNNTMEIDGYLLYRRVNTGSYDSLNQVPFTDTTYNDNALTGENKYYYRFCAFNTAGLFSRVSDSVYCRPITLDQGILVVDETNNWTTWSLPRDAQQDSFYNYIFSGYQYEPYEYGLSAQKPLLADFGPYSTLAWLADDYAGMLASGAVNDLKSYLGAGGKLWCAGWKPSGNLHNTLTYPADYTVGDISYDYFSITRTELSGTTDSFKTAIGLKGYPDITIDTLKYPSTIWGKTLRSIEALTPLAGADTIYVMDMKNNSSMFEGRACAVRDSGKTVFFGFPLYFMDKEQVKAAAQKIMAEFGEAPLGVVGKPENLEPIKDVRLFQNSPNPFSSQTNISYQLPKAGQVRLNIYNIAGQLIRALVNGEQLAGKYTVKWNRQDDHNRQVSAGVYIYHLSTDGKTQSRKMIVLK